MKRRRTILKYLAVFVSLNMLWEMGFPAVSYALTSGPSQPEVQSFEPIGTTEMVDLFSGDFVYNIPLLDVGGYPINISYHGGIGMDQEASWVGLGWDINPGAINRNMRGLPDDFDGDQVKKTISTKPQETYGLNLGGSLEFLGLDKNGKKIKKDPADVFSLPSIGIYYNNYRGVGYELSYNLPPSTQSTSKLNVGLGFNSQSGISINPSLNFEKQLSKKEDDILKISIGASYNSLAGLKELSFNSNFKVERLFKKSNKAARTIDFLRKQNGGASLSFGSAPYTPQISNETRNLSFNFNADIGFDYMTVHPNIKFKGYYSRQEIATNTKSLSAYGYMYSHKGANNRRALMDFNREKDMPYIKDASTNLPITNYTYDLFAASGHGTGGMFRPMRSDIGSVFDDEVSTMQFAPTSLGIELGFGTYVHYGGNINLISTHSRSGKWVDGNDAAFNLDFHDVNSTSGVGGKVVSAYEPFYFKQAGEKAAIDNAFYDKIGGTEPVRLKLGNNIPNAKALNTFERRNAPDISISGKIDRGAARDKRNSHFSYLYASEAKVFALDKKIRTYPLNQFYENVDPVIDYYAQEYTELDRLNDLPAKKHHLSEVTVTNPDGTRYIYGIPAYNIKQEETSFNINTGNCATGLTTYNAGDNTTGNPHGIDNYYNSTEMPAFVHSYLLTSIVSPDYVDITGNGITDDDLGTAIKLNYTKMYGNGTANGNYKWRTPFGTNSANYSEGLKTDANDDKANYVYGEKEIYYLHSIESKDYVAVFKLEDRDDSYGVNGRDGGKNTSQKLKCLKEIVLYSKRDLQNHGMQWSAPIKTVHFDYDYSLCQGIPNGTNGGGKLTLKSISFHYAYSQRGRLNPYKFTYSSYNPNYDIKAYDRWGNYKPNTGCSQLSNNDFPYAEQNRSLADQYAGAWSLKQVELPSGGIINVEYEADDYSYVQDRKAMRMIKIVGVSNSSSLAAYQKVRDKKGGNRLYDWSASISSQAGNAVGPWQNNPYVFFKMDPAANSVEDYIKGLGYLYFKFLVDITGKNEYEFITGYTYLEPGAYGDFMDGSDRIGWVKLKLEEVSTNVGKKDINPISRIAWNFTRMNLSSKIYHTNPKGDKESIIKSLAGFINQMQTMFTGFEPTMRRLGFGSRFVPERSFLRMMNPTQGKIGGGCRVKQVAISDNWANMGGDKTYDYGQTYGYTTTDPATGAVISSGVAEYEPMIGNDENPFRQPVFYTHKNLLAPDDKYTIEEPFGETFFPSPGVGYSKVTVKNLLGKENGNPVAHTGTGRVVHEFYTAKDFPIITDQTDLDVKKRPGKLISSILKIVSLDYATVSQGYTIELNDMHGKPKAEWVYAEGQEGYISGKEYKYKEDLYKGKRHLKNTVRAIGKDNQIMDNAEIGKEIDFVMDTRTSSSNTYNFGFALNVELTPVPPTPIPVPIPAPWPSFSSESTCFRSAVATKVIHRYGVLEKTILYDEDSYISNVNLLYDAETGEVLLTGTQNEFNDPVYQFNFPAHWVYDGMGQAYKNYRTRFNNIQTVSGYIRFASIGATGTDPLFNNYLVPGDEVYIEKQASTSITQGTIAPLYEYAPPVTTVAAQDRYWVYERQSGNPGGGTQLILIDRNGNLAPDFTPATQNNNSITYNMHIIRSGRRNQQGTSIGAITSLSNPAAGPQLSFVANPILNASAVEFKNDWNIFCCWQSYDKQTGEQRICDKFKPCKVVNPYVAGLLGNWRSLKSYTYLTERSGISVTQPNRNETNIRHDGTFMFLPQGAFPADMFWTYDPSGGWADRTGTYAANNWQYTAEVTEYDMHGQEIENMDPLGIYSSALYGYNSNLVTAVAGNADYNQIAFDGFEDYNFYESNLCMAAPHWNFLGSGALGSLRSTAEKHSGKYSLLVPAGQERNTYSALDGAEPDPDDYPVYELKPSDCIGGFAPKPGQYILNAWMKMGGPAVFSYDDLQVEVEVTGPGQSTPVSTITRRGTIIDGWQPVTVSFTVDPGATGIRVKLQNNTGTGQDAYFDDIRIQPFNSTMKAYVYDENSKKLKAILDDNNYATFYEYDPEGNLARVKKETYNGVMTLQESRQNLKKQ